MAFAANEGERIRRISLSAHNELMQIVSNFPQEPRGLATFGREAAFSQQERKRNETERRAMDEFKRRKDCGEDVTF